MITPLRNFNIILSPINSSLIDLPAPLNLSLFWNFGSLLGVCFILQIVSGLLLTIHYSAHTDTAFLCLGHITRDVNYGWLLRNLHANGASFFFLCLYLHMGRGLYYTSFNNNHTWNVGVTIFIISIATAFIGYLLPWGQISFWGATVITNLFSAIPYIGLPLVNWLWGGYGVANPTLTRFFTLHFLVPLIITIFVGLHLIFLHESGSSNPLGISSNSTNIPFHAYYTFNDIIGFTIGFGVLSYVFMYQPNYLGDPENFLPANPLVTPTHINPEWYFLWAYAILRSIPNNGGGVFIIFMSILLLYIYPITISPTSSTSTNIVNKTIIWFIILSLIILTWIGGSPVESPYETTGLIFTLAYFGLSLIIFSS